MTATLRVLFIDHNQNFAEAARKHLSRFDKIADVELVTDITKGRQKWQGSPFHLIFLDLNRINPGDADMLCLIKDELPHVKIVGLYLFDDDLSFKSYTGSIYCDAFISRANFAAVVFPAIKSLFPCLGDKPCREQGSCLNCLSSTQ